jgi:NAD(P)-dependent dehydrogenase (short-subunit alcohol dehydrogenase family)
MKADLSGKVALVTGAANGIGKAIAERLAANGAAVMIADVDGPGGAATAAALPDAGAVTMDVREPEAVARVIARILDRWGRLDILVNNAGVNTLAHRVDIDSFPLEEWYRIVSVDLDGVFVVSRAAVQPMLAQGAGRIINVLSVVGLVPLRLQSPFVAAKAGAAHLTRSMALELGPRGVLVNGIAPGSTLTEGTRKLFYGEGGKFHDRMARMMAHVPLGRPGETSEIADAALFLACPASSYVNGHILTVDGGWTAGHAIN